MFLSSLFGSIASSQILEFGIQLNLKKPE